jgi:hypothetical protein
MTNLIRREIRYPEGGILDKLIAEAMLRHDFNSQAQTIVYMLVDALLEDRANHDDGKLADIGLSEIYREWEAGTEEHFGDDLNLFSQYLAERVTRSWGKRE